MNRLVGSGCDDGYLKPLELSDLHCSGSTNDRSYESDNYSEELYTELCDVSLEQTTNRGNDNLSELEIRQNSNSGVTITNKNNASSTGDSAQQSCQHRQQILR